MELLPGPAEVGVGRVHGQHHQLDHAPAGKHKLAGIGAALASESERGFRYDVAVAQQPRHYLNLVGVPEPTGLGGAPSSHGDFDAHRQRLTRPDFGTGDRRQQIHDKAVNLQQHALAQQVLSRNQ